MATKKKKEEEIMPEIKSYKSWKEEQGQQFIERSAKDYEVAYVADKERENSWWGKSYDWITQEQEPKNDSWLKQTESDNFLLNALGTAGDIATNAAKGFVKGGIAVGNAGSYLLSLGEEGIGNLTNNQGLVDYAKKVREGINYTDNIVDNATKGIDKELDKYSWSGGKLDSVFESVGSSYAQAQLGGLLPGKGNIPVDIGKFHLEMPLTSVITGFSNSMREAYEDGATNGQAIIKGITGGLVEGFTEGMFGVFGQGGSSVEDKILGTLTKNIGNTVARNIAKVGIQAAGEGAEEVASYILNWAFDNGQDLVYQSILGKDYAKMGKEFSLQELGENFLSGALAGGFSSGAETIGRNVRANSNKVNAKNINAKVAVESENMEHQIYNKGVASLTEAQKEQLQGIVRNAIETNQGLNVDDVIAELNANETIRQNLLNEEKARMLEEKRARISEKTGKEISLENVELNNKEIKQAEKNIDKMIEEGKVDIEKIESQLNTQEDRDAFNQLVEQYGYTDAIREAETFVKENQKAFDEGKLDDENQALFRQYKSELDARGKALGEQQELISRYKKNANMLKSNKYNPYIKSYIEDYENKKAIVYDLTNDTNEKVKKFHEQINEAQFAGKQTHELVDTMSKLIERSNVGINVKSVDQAIEDGEILERKLTKAEQTKVNELQEQLDNTKDELQKDIIQQQIDEIKYEKTNGFYKDGEITVLYTKDGVKNVGVIIGHELRHALESSKLNDTYNEILKEYAKTQNTYSEEQNDYDYLMERIKKAYKTQLESKTEEEQQQILDSEFSAIASSNYLFTDNNFLNQIATKPTLGQKIKQFFTRIAKMFSKTKYKGSLDEIRDNYIKMLDEVAETGANVSENEQYSLDNQGRQLSEQQQEYFKDSKIRDDDGNLKVMYHGTSHDFTIFDWNKIGSNTHNEGIFGKGFYFTNYENLANYYNRDMFGKVIKDSDRKAMTGYLNITNPFVWQSIRTKEQMEEFAKEINAPKGLLKWNPYSNGGEIHSLTEEGQPGEFTELLKAAGYDGIIYNYSREAMELGDKYGTPGMTTQEVIAFESNQFKNVDNENPTDNPDIRYSIDLDGAMVDNETGEKVTLDATPVGNGTLMAITNMSENKLNGILDLGGFPVPSIAVTDLKKVPFEQFGDYTAIFNKDTIDPTISANKVYSRDAYTTRIPKVVNRLNEQGLKQVAKNTGLEEWDLRERYKESSIEDAVDNIKSEENVIDKYLESKGIVVEPQYRDYQGYSHISQKVLEKFIDEHPDFMSLAIPDMDSFATYEKYKNDIHDTYVENMVNEGASRKEAESLFEDYPSYSHYAHYFLHDIREVNELNGDRQIDDYATRENKEKYIDYDSTEYKDFVRNLVAPMFGERYVRNNKDFYTENGNPRSFDQRYIPYTLDNLVKIMKENQGTGQESGFFTGVSELAGDASKRFKSISDIKTEENRLTKTNDDEAYGIQLENYNSRLSNIVNQIMSKTDTSDIEAYVWREKNVEENLKDIARKVAEGKKLDADKVVNMFKGNYINISTKQANEILDFINELSDLPTDYFEAKPQRAVGLDEIMTLVVPNTMSESTKQRLDDMNIPYTYYDPTVEGDRNRVENEFEQYKFMLDNNLTPDTGLDLTRGETELRDYEKAELIQDFLNDYLGEETKTIDNVVDEIHQEYVIKRERLKKELRDLRNQLNQEEEIEEGYRPLTMEDVLTRDAELENYTPEYIPQEEDEFYYDTENTSPLDEQFIEKITKDYKKSWKLSKEQAQEFANDIREISSRPNLSRQDVADYINKNFSGEMVKQRNHDIAEVQSFLKDYPIGVSQRIKDEIASQYETFSNFRKNYYRKLKLTNDDGINKNVDQAYKELSEMYPYFFNEEEISNPTDQLLKIAEVADMDKYNSYFEPLPQDVVDAEIDELYSIMNDYRNEYNQYASENDRPGIEYYDALSENTELTPEDINQRIVDIQNELETMKGEEKQRIAEAKKEPEIVIKGKYDDRHDKYAKDWRKTTESIRKKVESFERVSNRIDYLTQDLSNFYEEYRSEEPTLFEEDLEEEIFKDYSQSKQDELTRLGERYENLQKEIDELDKKRQDLEKYMDKNKEIKPHKEIRGRLLDEMGITVEDLNRAKNISTFNLSRTDPVRVAEKIFGKEIGTKINEGTVNHVKKNEAERIRFLNKEREGIKALGIKARSAESAAVQKYGEGEYINNLGQLVKYGDNELAQEFSDKATQDKIKNAARDLRARYKKYLNMINRSITNMGYDPIPERKDYFRHFNELNDKLSQWGIPFNLETMKSENLPTDINGITDQFKPGKQWFASALHREGVKTTYDAITGIDGYLEGATNLIFHTKDIQRYRALSEYIRNTYGAEKGFNDTENMTEEERQDRISKIQNNYLSSYAAWLDEQANALANKKGKIDRGVEELFGRRAYTALNTIKQQVGSNMTGFNVRSALTNFISTTLAAGRTNKTAMLKGTVDTINNMFHDDGFANKSDFLTSRFGSERLSNKLWQRIANTGQIFMNGTDKFTANLIVRSKYQEGLMKGMTEKQAMRYADDFAARVMGDRSKGATATIFNSKTLGVLTQFQLETNNQLDYLLHDSKMELEGLDQTAKSNAIKGMIWQMGQIFAYSYFYNELFEKLTGSRAAFDPIDIFKKLAGADDDDKDKTLEERSQEAIAELVDTLPFTSLLGKGGRMPISEAFEGTNLLYDYLTGETDAYGNRIKAEDVAKQFKEDLGYWLMPTGYGQVKKTKGAYDLYFDENGNPREVPGSYTDSGKLRFQADTDPTSVLENLIFGQWSSEQAQEYISGGFKSLTEKQQAQMVRYGMTKSEYLKYKEGMKGLTKKADKKAYIESLNYPEDIKQLMINDL